MSAQTHGLSSVTFGVPTLTGYVIQDYSRNKAANVSVEVINESGRKVYHRLDDVKTDLSISAVFNGATLPTVGTTLTYDGTLYIVTNVDEKGSNKDVKRVDIKGVTTEYLTLS